MAKKLTLKTPDELRKKINQTGIFLIAYEVLEDCIVDNLREFLSNEWTFEKGWITSPEYKSKVLDLDPKGKGDALRGSLVWLLNNGAINERDRKRYFALRSYRNYLAHELHKHLFDTENREYEKRLANLLELNLKIAKWWVVEVEIPVSGDFNPEDIDLEGVMPGTAAILQMLKTLIIGNDDEAWDLHNALVVEQTTRPCGRIDSCNGLRIPGGRFV